MTKSPLETSRGTLSLTGSGEYLPEMEPVDKMLLERVGAAPKVVCLPTAAAPDGATIVANWARMGVEHFTKLGAQTESINILTHKDADTTALADKVRAANFVYLSGGKPDYLYKTLANTETFKALNEVLNNGGVVAGCSAGAMIWGEKIPSFPTLVPLHDVFNYLPGSIIMPHFDEFGDRWGAALKLAMGERTILGIDGFTALVCQQGQYQVAGKSAVTVWNKKQRVRYTHGQSLSWGKPV